ncbi:MAG: T9SS type A sorting domain-containing protein [Bacteroidetes bacterium]|nr:T9SS type A sorting domain-containing protein [Bacteroidota bacterium]
MLSINKILVFFIAWTLSVNCLFAQNLSLTDTSANDITNDTLIISGTTTALVADVEITNNSSSTISIKVKKIENYLVSGSINTFCWGQCFSPFTYVSPNPIDIDGGGINKKDFHGDYTSNDNQGTSIITYVFFDADNPDDSASVTVLFEVGLDDISSNINEVNSFNVYPNPATDYVNISGNSMNNHSSAKIIIYDALGSVVKEIKISGSQKNITVPVNDWKSGTYFYTLIERNDTKVKKIVVRH